MNRSRLFLVATLAAATVGPVLASPAWATVLHNQLTAPGSFANVNDGSPANYAEAADDFTVPAGETWTVEGVTALFTSTSPFERVRIYSDNGLGTAPPATGGVLFQQDTRTPSVLNPAAGPLGPGRYWVSVLHQPTGGGWVSTPVQSGSPAVYDRPGAACPRWTKLTTCTLTNEPDLAFAVTGTKTVTPPAVARPKAKKRCKPKQKAGSSAAKKRCKRKK